MTWITTGLPDRNDSLASALRSFLQAVLEQRTITAGNPEDDEFERAARAVDEAIGELAGAEARASLSLRIASLILMRRLGEAHYHRERAADAIDVDGWLELPWNPAPALIIAGFNEGAIPTVASRDAFLTDSLRAVLGIRSDADILARDAFLLQGIIESRRRAGSTWLIAGKVSDSGDPVRPSRLLLQCDDNGLPERARHLFRDISSPRARPAATASFQLDPDLPATAPLSAISVTAFRDYLACPFRFYLKHVLRMEEQNDSKRTPDALDFGILIHDALQRMGEADELSACTDPRIIAEFLTRRAEKWIARQYGKTPPLPIRMTLHSAQQRLEAAARVQAELAAEGWEIIAVEQPFKGELGDLTVKGKIDRIDRHRDTGALRVIDYKSSDSASEPAKAHLGALRGDTPDYAQVTVAGKDRRWTDLQLPLYAVLGMLDTETPPEPAYFSLPRAVSDTALHPWPTFTAELASAAFETAGAIVEKICEGDFWPPSEKVDYDDYESLFHTGTDGWKPLLTHSPEP